MLSLDRQCHQVAKYYDDIVYDDNILEYHQDAHTTQAVVAFLRSDTAIY